MKKSNETNQIRGQEHRMCERRDWGVIWISHAMKPPSAPTPAVQTPQNIHASVSNHEDMVG